MPQVEPEEAPCSLAQDGTGGPHGRGTSSSLQIRLAVKSGISRRLGTDRAQCSGGIFPDRVLCPLTYELASVLTEVLERGPVASRHIQLHGLHARRSPQQQVDGFLQVRLGIGGPGVGDRQAFAVPEIRLRHVDQGTRQQPPRFLQVPAAGDHPGEESMTSP